ncbi:MAG: hypothetical protein LBG92_05035 [Prevotellaceae bacterium]|jgi:hypothetical protein|nr:hypothetical protein [Prevotellaceae bacterium]
MQSADSDIPVMKALRMKVLKIIELYDIEKRQTLYLQSQLQEKEREIDRLSSENNRLKLVAAFKSAGDAREAKKLIGKLVREIDECVALLNK